MRAKRLVTMALFLVMLLTAGITAHAKTISYWDVSPADLVPLRMSIFEEFKRQHDVEIEYVNVPAGDMRQKLVTAVITGNVPDTVFFQSTWLGEFMAMNALLDMGPYVSSSLVAEEVIPQAFEVGRAPSGAQYYIASEYQIPGLYYRRDLLSDVGMQGAPANWDDMLEAAKKLTSPQENRYGFSLRGAAGAERYYIMWMLMANGNRFFDVDGSAALSKYGGTDGLRWYGELFTRHGVATPNSVNNSFLDNTAEFSSGAAGMYIHNQYSVNRQVNAFGGTIEEALESVGTAPIPQGPTGRFVPANFTNGYVIMGQSQEPELAWKLIEHILSVKPQSDWAQTSGALPANSHVFNEPWLRENPLLAPFISQLEDPPGSFYFPVQLPRWNALIADPLVTEFQKALLGQQTFERMATTVNRLIDEARQ